MDIVLCILYSVNDGNPDKRMVVFKCYGEEYVKIKMPICR